MVRKSRFSINAQINIAYIYHEGLGMEKPDYFKAFEYYKKAAEKGNFQAQYALGNMYMRGEGVEPDFDTAMEWYKKAAESAKK